MPELVPAADEAAWLEERRKGVTASEIAVLMGLSPYSSPYALYHQKLGILPDQADSDMMERGRVLEPHIREKFGAAHPEFTVMGDGRSLYRHPERPWQMATPDSTLFALDANGFFDLEEPCAVLECKVDGGSDEWGEEGTDEIPVHYRCQGVWQMDVMGVERAYVSCLDPARWRIREYVIEHDGSGPDCQVCKDQALMLGEAQRFLGRIERRDVPDVDWRPATADALKKLHPTLSDEGVFVTDQLAKRWRASLKNLKYWERRKDLYQAQLRERMGSARRALIRSEDIPAGEVIARRDVYEVKAHERKASTTDKLVPVYPKKEKKSVSNDSR